MYSKFQHWEYSLITPEDLLGEAVNHTWNPMLLCLLDWPSSKRNGSPGMEIGPREYRYPRWVGSRAGVSTWARIPDVDLAERCPNSASKRSNFQDSFFPAWAELSREGKAVIIHLHLSLVKWIPLPMTQVLLPGQEPTTQAAWEKWELLPPASVMGPQTSCSRFYKAYFPSGDLGPKFYR